MSNKLKTALVGAGIIGNVHAQCMSTLETPFGAICDIDTKKAEALLLYSPDAKIYGNFEQMIAEYEPDVIHICTPHYLHAEMIIYALSRDINVLCEKPLCINYGEIDDILSAEKNSNAKLGICFQNRYLPANIFAKNYLKDKEILNAHGKVIWSRTAEYYRSAEWRGTLDMEGGGALINQAIHTLDLLRWMCGEPDSVLAATDNLSLKGVIEVEDTVTAFYDGKQPFGLYATNAAACSLPVEINFKLANKENIVLLPDTVIIDGEVRFSEKTHDFLGKDCYGNGHTILISDFYDCLINGKNFSINGTEAAKTMHLVLKTYQSNRDKIKI